MKKKVIIVEDNELILLLNQRYLAKCDCDVVGATTDFEEFGIMVAQLNPDIILMDVFLGQDRDGIDFIASLTDSAARVIYLSGTSDPVIMEKAKATQYHSFLQKPVLLSELISAIYD